jgi:3-hydroxyisobutyrate dehydrogenase
MAKLAFLGLGVMGFPMAGHLVTKGGHEVTVFNRTSSKAKAWAEKFGGRTAATPQAAAEGQDLVMACVGNDDDVRAITIGAGGAFAAMKRGAIFVDHTTASAEVARELEAEATKRGFSFIDAPVSGGQAGAENGALTVMCGGSEEAYATAAPVIAAYAKMSKRDVNAVIETISKGAAQSWQMDNRHKTMNEGKFDFGFAVEWMRKDLSICLAEARRNGASLPVTALVDAFYSEVEKMGGRRWDTSSLLARLER